MSPLERTLSAILLRNNNKIWLRKQEFTGASYDDDDDDDDDFFVSGVGANSSAVCALSWFTLEHTWSRSWQAAAVPTAHSILGMCRQAGE